MSGPQGTAPLPPGWDEKYDARTSRYYYINHYTKTTSWEDPREKYQQIGKPTTAKENRAPAGGVYGAPAGGVYGGVYGGAGGGEAEPGPRNQISLMDYRQRSASPGAKAATPLLSGLRENYIKGTAGSPQPLARLQQEETAVGGYQAAGGGYQAAGGGYQAADSPSRSTLRRDSHIQAELNDMEANLANTEQAVSKIAAMFPTVEESHIRELYKKYHGSTAVVTSALQVAKHPITCTGPANVFTPPPPRHATLPGVSSAVLANMTMTGSLPYNFNPSMTPLLGNRDLSSMADSSGYPTPRPGTAASDLDTSLCMGSPQISANLFRSFPKPHSSPKMKLRYLKSVFPTVEEYLLLDVLANSDNNVQKAADRLVKMGYVKRDAPSAPRLHAKKREEERLAEKRTPLPKPPPIKTDTEKETLRNKMKDKYEKRYEIPERILFMALESVLYDEEQANNLITSMIEDDLKRQKQKEAEKAAKAKERAEKKKSPKPVRKIMAAEAMPKSPKKTATQPSVTARKAANKQTQKPRVSQGTSTQDEVDRGTTATSSLAQGPNQALRKGPNDDLLLTDYVVWNGPDTSNRKGTNKDLVHGSDNALANGPNPNNRRGGAGAALGPNPANRRGPQALNKGSRMESFGGQPIRSC